MRYLKLLILLSVCYLPTAWAEREVLGQASESEEADAQRIADLLAEQNILQSIFSSVPGIVVTPYYDQFGRTGVKIVPERGEIYYVDPYFDDPMTTNRHSDEPSTSSNWRVFTWGDD